MTQYEMTEKLSEKCNVSLAEAKAALEQGDWNTLTATHLLEQERFRRMQELNEAAGAAVAVQEAPEDVAAVSDRHATEEMAAEASDCQASEEAASDAAAASDRHAAKAAPRAKARRSGHGMKNLGEHVRRLVGWANRNRLVVRRDGVTALDIPVSVAALLMLFAPWVCVPLLVIGLFAGCKYSFDGAAAEFVK